jgi:putative ABC transport system permease protein
VERQREYGVLKAIGATNTFLYRIVLTQALAASLVGSIMGVLASYGVGMWIMSVRPQFLIVVDPADVRRAFVASLVMALLAAIFPIRVVAGLAPAEVFRK